MNGLFGKEEKRRKNMKIIRKRKRGEGKKKNKIVKKVRGKIEKKKEREGKVT